MKLYQILPDSLYLRGRFEHFEDRVSRLEELKIDSVVSMIKFSDDEVRPCVDYYHLPTRDDGVEPSNLTYLHEMAAVLASQITQGGKVLVHCRRGRNRSAFMCGLILHHLGWSGLRIVDHIKAVRPNSLDNPFFERHLAALRVCEVL